MCPTSTASPSFRQRARRFSCKGWHAASKASPEDWNGIPKIALTLRIFGQDLLQTPLKPQKSSWYRAEPFWAFRARHVCWKGAVKKFLRLALYPVTSLDPLLLSYDLWCVNVRKYHSYIHIYCPIMSYTNILCIIRWKLRCQNAIPLKAKTGYTWSRRSSFKRVPYSVWPAHKALATTKSGKCHLPRLGEHDILLNSKLVWRNSGVSARSAQSWNIFQIGG